MIDYQEFFSKFGGSLRTKNLVPTTNSIFDFKNVVRYLLKRWPYSDEVHTGNKRPYNIPSDSALPKEYIRLCPWEAEYLYLLASKAKLGIVETGRFHGGSTFMLAYANRIVPIHSVDIAPQNDALVRAYLTANDFGANVDLIVGDSQNVKYPHVGMVDMLFIDGDHSYEGCTRDLENWYPSLAPGGHIVLHDCYFGSPVQDSVINFMREHPEVSAIQSPYIHASYWHHPCGSLAHLVRNYG